MKPLYVLWHKNGIEVVLEGWLGSVVQGQGTNKEIS